jgi:hypothetical protein
VFCSITSVMSMTRAMHGLVFYMILDIIDI